MSNSDRKLELSDDLIDGIRAALDEMEELSHYDASEASVACDGLASALIDAFLPGERNPFTGRAPELHEVLEELEDEINLSTDASEAALEISMALEDAYDLEDNEELAEQIKEYADAIVERIRKFLNELPEDDE